MKQPSETGTADSNRIELWYGDEQQFGQAGNPQPLINILGNVRDAANVRSVSFSLNGGAARNLKLGQDDRRLARTGDFNIELVDEELNAGSNTVVIAAVYGDGQSSQRTVLVRYVRGQGCPLPYRIDWSRVERIQDVAQVVDGHWRLGKDGVRTLDPYYDRLIALGDASWKDYEVTVDVTVHRHRTAPPAPGPPFTTTPHATVGVRWQGHYEDGNAPRHKWHPLGAIAMLQSSPDWPDQRWVLHGGEPEDGESGKLVTETSGRKIRENVKYRYKMRVESLTPPNSRYSVKVWKADETEPTGWDVEGIDGGRDLRSGSVLLCAHHTDVTFGNVSVVPLRD